MLAGVTALVLAAVALMWTAVNRAGKPSGPWFVAVLMIGVALVICGAWARSSDRSRLPRWLQACLSLWIAFVAFQFVPLPFALLHALSPARAALANATLPVAGGSAAPIAVEIPGGLLWFVTLLACLALFFIVRQVSFTFSNRLWTLVLPLTIVGLLEAAIGLLQRASGADQATGTFANRDHYGCLLEMIVPISVSCGLTLVKKTARKDGRNASGAMRAVGASLFWIASLVMLLGIFASLSRGATVAVLFGLCFLAVAEVTPLLRSRAKRLGFFAAIGIAVVVFLVLVVPAALQERFVGAMTTGSESRVDIWKESLPLAKQYFFFGIGLKGFQPAFEQYQRVALSTIANYAHNDYLEYFEELGLIGFSLLAACIAGALWPMFRALGRSDLSVQRSWCVGCAASLAALMLHSTFDFNLYEPVDVMAACWIAGLGYFSASALISDRRPMRSR